MIFEKCGNCKADTEYTCRVARISLERMLLAIDMGLSPVETTPQERQDARTAQRDHNLEQIRAAGCGYTIEELRHSLPERASRSMADIFGYQLLEDE